MCLSQRSLEEPDREGSRSHATREEREHRRRDRDAGCRADAHGQLVPGHAEEARMEAGDTFGRGGSERDGEEGEDISRSVANTC